MAEPFDFEVYDREYRAMRMNAMDQLQVMRRLMPIAGAFGDFMKYMAERRKVENREDDKQGNGEDDKQGMLDAMGPLMKSFAAIPDDDVNYILDKCLTNVTRKELNDRGWVRIWNHAAQRPQVEDIDLMALMQIVFTVLENSLNPFSADQSLSSVVPLSRLTGNR